MIPNPTAWSLNPVAHILSIPPPTQPQNAPHLKFVRISYPSLLRLNQHIDAVTRGNTSYNHLKSSGACDGNVPQDQTCC